MNAGKPNTTSGGFLHLQGICGGYLTDLQNTTAAMCVWNLCGRYWAPVFNALEKTCNVCLTHPKYVKAIKGKKNGKKDAKWISELFKCDLVRSSFIPPPDIRKLRDLCRYYVKLTALLPVKRTKRKID